MDREPEP